MADAQVWYSLGTIPLVVYLLYIDHQAIDPLPLICLGISICFIIIIIVLLLLLPQIITCCKLHIPFLLYKCYKNILKITSTIWTFQLLLEPFQNTFLVEIVILVVVKRTVVDDFRLNSMVLQLQDCLAVEGGDDIVITVVVQADSAAIIFFCCFYCFEVVLKKVFYVFVITARNLVHLTIY